MEFPYFMEMVQIWPKLDMSASLSFLSINKNYKITWMHFTPMFYPNSLYKVEVVENLALRRVLRLDIR